MRRVLARSVVVCILASLFSTIAQGQIRSAGSPEWQSYMPLAIGNTWQFSSMESIPPDGRVVYVIGEWLVEGSTTIDDNQYFLLRECSQVEGESPRCQEPIPLRYGSGLLIMNVDGEERWWSALPCALESEPDEQAICSPPASPDTPVYSFAVDTDSVVVGKEVIRNVALRGFSLGGISSVTFVAGIGPVVFEDVNRDEGPGWEGPTPRRLVYAQIGGENFGEKLFEFATSIEDSPSRTVDRLSIYPTPASEAIQIELEPFAGSPVIVEVFDVVGRLVEKGTTVFQSTGAHVHVLDTSLLTSGAYFVRVSAGRISRTGTFIKL
jgi:hypothetical protein